MIIDHVSKETNNKGCIEAYIEEDGVGIWIPVMGMDLRSMSKGRELLRIKEIRVRRLEEK